MNHFRPWPSLHAAMRGHWRRADFSLSTTPPPEAHRNVSIRETCRTHFHCIITFSVWTRFHFFFVCLLGFF
ncbi:unnamed protein product [Tetraodon nigroviridis]|uniref:(spotted green pufferfish) hypothetical protein n=1 Tax=Tetraodon nigroviridis TaxID=99883 RepID=Q4T7T0_TETNG|nr:unnamed protein product [Tetraodon nigroviridis]